MSRHVKHYGCRVVNGNKSYWLIGCGNQRFHLCTRDWELVKCKRCLKFKGREIQPLRDDLIAMDGGVQKIIWKLNVNRR